MLQAKGSRIAERRGCARPSLFILRGLLVEFEVTREADQRQRTGQRGPAPPSLHQHIAAYSTTLDVDDEERDDLRLASSNRFPVAPFS